MKKFFEYLSTRPLAFISVIFLCLVYLVMIFAEFIAMINYLDNNGITTEPNMIYNRHKYRLSYFFEYAPLKTVVKSVLAPLFESIKNGEFENDDLTRIEYEDTLKQFNVPIIQH